MSIPKFAVEIDFSDVQTSKSGSVKSQVHGLSKHSNSDIESSDNEINRNPIFTGRGTLDRKGTVDDDKKKKKKKKRKKDKGKSKKRKREKIKELNLDESRREKKRKRKRERKEKSSDKKKKKRNRKNTSRSSSTSDSPSESSSGSEIYDEYQSNSNPSGTGKPLDVFFVEKSATKPKFPLRRQTGKHVKALVNYANGEGKDNKFRYFSISKEEKETEMETETEELSFSKYKPSSNNAKISEAKYDFLPLYKSENQKANASVREKDYGDERKKDIKEAVVDIDNALRLDPNNCKLWRRRLYLVLRLETYEQTNRPLREKQSLKRNKKQYIGFLRRLENFYDKALEACKNIDYRGNDDDEQSCILELCIGRLRIVSELFDLRGVKEFSRRGDLSCRDLLSQWLDFISRFNHDPRIVAAFLQLFIRGTFKLTMQKEKGKNRISLKDFYPTILKIIRACLSSDHSCNKNGKMSPYLLDVFDQYFIFLSQAGEDGVALALYKALFEYNCARPMKLELQRIVKNLETVKGQGDLLLKNSFKSYWESDAPKVGESPLSGWDNWYQRINAIANTTATTHHSVMIHKCLLNYLEKKSRRSENPKRSKNESRRALKKDRSPLEVVVQKKHSCRENEFPKKKNTEELKTATPEISTRKQPDLNSKVNSRPSAADFFDDLSEDEEFERDDVKHAEGRKFDPRNNLSTVEKLPESESESEIGSDYIYSAEHGKRIKINMEKDELNNADMYKSILASLSTHRLLKGREKKFKKKFKSNDVGSEGMLKNDIGNGRLDATLVDVLIPEQMSKPDIENIVFGVQKDDPIRIDICRRLLAQVGVNFTYAHKSGQSDQHLLWKRKSGLLPNPNPNLEYDYVDSMYSYCMLEDFLPGYFTDNVFKSFYVQSGHNATDPVGPKHKNSELTRTCILQAMDRFPENVEFMSLFLAYESEQTHSGSKTSNVVGVERVRCIAKYLLGYLESISSPDKYQLWVAFAEIEARYGTVRKSRLVYDKILNETIIYEQGTKREIRSSVSQIVFNFLRLEVSALAKSFKRFNFIPPKTKIRLIRILSCASGASFITEHYCQKRNSRDKDFHNQSVELSKIVLAMVKDSLSTKCKAELSLFFKEVTTSRSEDRDERLNVFVYTIACFAWFEYFISNSNVAKSDEVLEKAIGALIAIKDEATNRKYTSSESAKCHDHSSLIEKIDRNLYFLFTVSIDLHIHASVFRLQHPADSRRVEHFVRKGLVYFPSNALLLASQTHLEIRKFCSDSFFDVMSLKGVYARGNLAILLIDLFDGIGGENNTIAFWLFALFKCTYKLGIMLNTTVKLTDVQVGLNKSYLKTHRQLIRKGRKLFEAAKFNCADCVLFWRLFAYFEAAVRSSSKNKIEQWEHCKNVLVEGLQVLPFSRSLNLDLRHIFDDTQAGKKN